MAGLRSAKHRFCSRGHLAGTGPFPTSNRLCAAGALRHGLNRAKAALRALERRPADAQGLASYDDLNALMEDWAGPIYLLSNVHPDKAIRDAADACELRW